jgi:hypothetical protein
MVAGAGSNTLAEVGRADGQLQEVIQMKGTRLPMSQGTTGSCHPLASHASSDGSSGGRNVAALKSRLRALRGHWDHAGLQVAAPRESSDQLLASPAAHTVQEDSRQELLREASEVEVGCAAIAWRQRGVPQEGLDARAGESAAQKAIRDTHTAPAGLGDDDGAAEGGSAQARAGCGRLAMAAALDKAAQKVQYEKLQVGAAQHQQGYDVQEALYAKLEEDAAELPQGYDGLAAANQNMADEASSSKASFDLQTASYDKLQARAHYQPVGRVVAALPVIAECVVGRCRYCPQVRNSVLHSAHVLHDSVNRCGCMQELTPQITIDAVLLDPVNTGTIVAARMNSPASSSC